MTAYVTECQKCGASFQWSGAAVMPDCPSCGHNPDKRLMGADTAALIELLQQGDDGAAVELGKRRDRTATPALVAALRRPGTFLTSVVALGRIGDERAVQPLMSLSKNKPHPDVLHALVKIGSDRAVKYVAEAVAKDGYGLNHEGFPSLFSKLKNGGEESVAILCRMLENNFYLVRDYAQATLGEMDWRPTEGQQVSLCLARQDWAGLKELGEPAIAILLESANAKALLRIEATADQIGSATPELAKAFARLLDDKELVDRAAAFVLALDEEQAAGLLVDALKYGASCNRTLKRHLRELGAPAVSALLEHLGGARRFKALEVLQGMDDGRILPALTKRLKSLSHRVNPSESDQHFLELIVRALGEMKDDRAARQLVEFVNQLDDKIDHLKLAETTVRQPMKNGQRCFGD
jgi:HEAT repeat protein